MVKYKIKVMDEVIFMGGASYNKLTKKLSSILTDDTFIICHKESTPDSPVTPITIRIILRYIMQEYISILDRSRIIGEVRTNYKAEKIIDETLSISEK